MTSNTNPVKQMRVARGWTQTDLARRASRVAGRPIPTCTICRIEQGRSARVDVLIAVRRVLGATKRLEIVPLDVGVLR